MDDADMAEDKIEAAITDGIGHARYMLTKTKLTPCGSCYYCDSVLRTGEIFCDKLCLSDYQYEQERKKAQGIR